MRRAVWASVLCIAAGTPAAQGYELAALLQLPYPPNSSRLARRIASHGSRMSAACATCGAPLRLGINHSS